MRQTMLYLPAILAFIAGTPAQAYPERPIRLIVASAPGGAPDILARAVAQKLSVSAGQQIVVDNRAGASGLIGAEIAAKAAPDGYTLFLGTTTLYAILPNLRKQLPYDIERDFAAVTQIASASNVLVINPSVPAQSLAELIRIGRDRPGTLNYASAGRGTPAHLAGEMLNLMAGTKMTHVPYKGAGPALLDVVAGQVQLIITSPIAAGPHIGSGKVRALATTGKTRNPALPSLPAIAELLPDYDITQWWGLSARAGTPAPVLQRIRILAIEAVRAPEVSDRIRRTGAIPAGEGAERFSAFAKAERQRLGEIIRKAGISLN
jgi:tripartite-type tricarboxylate transporter receptor subunit TctC